MDVAEPTTSTSLVRRYRKVIVVALVLFLVYSAANAYLSASKPPSKERVAVNRAVTYFARTFNVTLGLIPERPGSPVYWLYSDNYLAALVLIRYDPSNQSTVSFGRALNYVVQSYASTLPPGLGLSQYTALNSMKSSFECSRSYELGWARNGSTYFADKPGAVLMTTSNDGTNSCASVAQNYGDLLFLEALMAHRLGDNSSSLAFYRAGAADFDGTGIRDRAFTDGSPGEVNTYQTYKVALYIYAAVCLGQQATDPNFRLLEPLLLSQQDVTTGGFFTGSYPNGQPALPNPNTETTALAALALEELAGARGGC